MRSCRRNLARLCLFLALASPAAAAQVTDATATLRLKAESRDDRFFKQVLWGDRDIAGEWRLRGTTALEHEAARLEFELQDQRVMGSDPPVWLDASPMPTPFSTVTDAGLRLAGSLTVTFGEHRIRAGRFAVEAAGGRLLGADEYRTGYRPYGLGWGTARFANQGEIDSGGLLWIGAHEWHAIVGTTLVGLARYAVLRPRFALEGGLLGRRAPSRPLFSGVREVSATPYVFWRWEAAPGRLTTELLGAYQIGQRAYRPRSSSLSRRNSLDEGLGLVGRAGIYYTGDPGDRPVRAYYVRSTAAWRLPIPREPTWSGGFHLASGGGDRSVDRSFLPFQYDTHRFFGSAGYFGARNARSAHTALSVPLGGGVTAKVAVWRMHVVSPREGLYLESGELFAPSLYPESARKAATSHDAIREWDAEVHWTPPGTGFLFRIAYSEIRHGEYFRQVIDAGSRHRPPPAQWMSVLGEYRL